MQSVPVQSWTFEQESVIRIGRSTDNHVILYSAVVSRHHVEIRKNDANWEIVNLGANGTYLEGRRITQVPVEDGVIIRLARSGPNIQIHLGAQSPAMARGLVGESTVGQRARSSVGSPVIPTQSDLSKLEEAAPTGTTGDQPIPQPITQQPSTDINGQDGDGQDGKQGNLPGLLKEVPPYLETTAEGNEWTVPEPKPQTKPTLSECCYRYLESDRLFCLDCGKPLRVLGAIADYQVLRTLEETSLSLTQLAWRDGRTVILITPSLEGMKQSIALDGFAQESRHLLQISHPVFPRFLELFYVTQQPYLVMEPIYGQTLQQFVANTGPLSQIEAISVLLQICDGLNYLHQQTPPILHLAIKPDHLVRRAIAAPSLSITGLIPCRHLDLTSRHLPADYAAPEPQQGQASPASDLYALGPTLAYLLTGNPPSAFYAHREQGFRFYPEYIPGLNPNLVTIIRKLTNPQPEERFASAQDLADALQQIT